MRTTTPTPPAHYAFDPGDWLRLVRCWHPVARACSITGAPVKTTLLDEQLVICRIKGQVVIARGVCPYHGVSLTLGFYEEEGIVCPYHSLRFGEDGRCNRIPSNPGQPIPAKLHLTSFAVEERYGLVWTCLACDPDNPPPLPTMSHWDGAGFQQVNCPAFEVKGFAGHQVKSFLDIARFARVRIDTFVDPDNRQVPNCTPQETPFDFIADYWSSADNYPASSDFHMPGGFQRLHHFEMHLPFTATLTIHFPADARLVIMSTASPVSSRMMRIFTPIARNFNLHVPVEDVRAFNLRVSEEDRLIVKTRHPERLPLDPALGAHIPTGRSSIAYRCGLKKMGFDGFFLI